MPSHQRQRSSGRPTAPPLAAASSRLLRSFELLPPSSQASQESVAAPDPPAGADTPPPATQPESAPALQPAQQTEPRAAIQAQLQSGASRPAQTVAAQLAASTQKWPLLPVPEQPVLAHSAAPALLPSASSPIRKAPSLAAQAAAAVWGAPPLHQLPPGRAPAPAQPAPAARASWPAPVPARHYSGVPQLPTHQSLSFPPAPRGEPLGPLASGSVRLSFSPSRHAMGAPEGSGSAHPGHSMPAGRPVSGAAPAGGGRSPGKAASEDGGSPGKPSRARAVHRREVKLLYEFGRDAAGMSIAGSQRPFSLRAPPRAIGQESLGLGIYFTSGILYMLLMLGMCLLAIYPVVDNKHQDAYAYNYTVFTDSQALGACTKPWQVTSSLLQTTIGTFCADPQYSSYFSCAAGCRYNSSRLAAPQCAGLPAQPAYAAGLAGAERTCALHAPCNSAASKNASAPDGPCYCCDMALQEDVVKANAPVDAAQLWLLLLGQLLFLGWLLVLRKVQATAAQQIDASVMTAGDFSVYVRGLGSHTSDTQLAEWARHYGMVVSAHNLVSAGHALHEAGKVEALRVAQAELQAEEADPQRPACILGRLARWSYHTTMVGKRGTVEAALAAAQNRLAAWQDRPLVPTGYGLITFSYEAHSDNCLLDHRHRAHQHLVAQLSCGACAPHAPRVGGQVVHVSRAPEPSDFVWENTAVPKHKRHFRRALSFLATAVAMTVGGAVQYGLAVAVEAERQRRLVASAVGPSQPLSFGEQAVTAARLHGISALSGIFVVAMNFVIAWGVRELAYAERWSTVSQREKWHTLKLTVFYLVNSFMVPVLATSLSGTTSTWYSRGGLIEQAFYIQLTNAVLPPLLALVNPYLIMCRHVWAGYARTQAMLDLLLGPSEFCLAERYAAMVKTVGLALFYAPALPLSPVLALGGLVAAYWADKWVALRQAERPPSLSGRVTAEVTLLVRCLPLVQMILMYRLYFASNPNITPVFWTGIALWALAALGPWERLLGIEADSGVDETGATHGLSFHETIGKAASAAAAAPPALPAPHGGDATAHVQVVVAAGTAGAVSAAAEARPTLYIPQVPSVCSQQFRSAVAAAFALLPAPLAPVETLLEGQRHSTGGPYTRPPPRRATATAVHTAHHIAMTSLGDAASSGGMQVPPPPLVLAAAMQGLRAGYGPAGEQAAPTAAHPAEQAGIPGSYAPAPASIQYPYAQHAHPADQAGMPASYAPAPAQHPYAHAASDSAGGGAESLYPILDGGGGSPGRYQPYGGGGFNAGGRPAGYAPVAYDSPSRPAAPPPGPPRPVGHPFYQQAAAAMAAAEQAQQAAAALPVGQAPPQSGMYPQLYQHYPPT